MSASRGTEAALLVAQDLPQLLHGAVLYAPASVVHESSPRPDGVAWTLRGQAVLKDLIPVDHIDGPVLAVAGSDDRLWESNFAAPLIVHELDQANRRFPHEALVVQGAGHSIGGAPYLPHGSKFVYPGQAEPFDTGGTHAANESALLQGWTKVLELLASIS